MKKVLYFSASWCSPCKTLAPVIDELVTESGLVVEKVNIDDNSQLVQRFNIRSVPTVVYLNSHEVETQRITGVQPKFTYLSAWNKTK